MKRLLYILLLFALPAKAQLIQSFGGARGTDTAYTPNSLRFDKVFVAPYYKVANDTTFIGILSNAKGVPVSISLLRSTISGGSATQQALIDTATTLRQADATNYAILAAKIAATIQYVDTLPGVGQRVTTTAQLNTQYRGAVDSLVTGQTWNSTTKVLSTTRRNATATTVTLSGLVTYSDSTSTFATKAYVYNSHFTVTISSTTRQITDSRLSGRDVESLYYGGMTFYPPDFVENDNVVEMQGTRYFRAGYVVQVNLK